MKVLFASSEAVPFAASGGLADVAGALPKALRQRFVGCRVVLPLYACVTEEQRAGMKFLCHFDVPVGWRRQYCGVFEARAGGVIYYLLDNEYYFKRPNLYGYYDEAERFAFLSRAVLELLRHIDYRPDVIHCNDWQTALVPVYYRLFYQNDPLYAGMKTVFTIHNVAYQGVYGMSILGDVFGIPAHGRSLLEYHKDINMMKGAVEAADAVTTVSPTYANELMAPWAAHGLDGFLRARRQKLSGILNGIDIETYNPETDPALEANYTVDDLSGKVTDKHALQRLLGLPETGLPVVAMVTRLAAHKGVDLITRVFSELLSWDLQFVLLGSGEREYEAFFTGMAARFPKKFAFRKGFIPDLAHKIYAGADIFLMPSYSEPCGLSQMVALRYGTIPVVRETGGLHDTIQDSGSGEGNGFTFRDYNAHQMLTGVGRAIAGFGNEEGWAILQTRAMGCDHSWKRSAAEYAKLYQSLLA